MWWLRMFNKTSFPFYSTQTIVEHLLINDSFKQIVDNVVEDNNVTSIISSIVNESVAQTKEECMTSIDTKVEELRNTVVLDEEEGTIEELLG